MSVETIYMVSIPGSTEPPFGPLGLDEILARVGAGSIPRVATVCKVGDADWMPVERLLPRPAPVVPLAASKAPMVPSRRAYIEGRYANLASVGAGVAAYGGLIKGLGIVLIVGGVLATFFAFSGENHESVAFIAVPAAFFGVLVHVAGTIVAAMGEGMNALKDIAVNTGVVADLEEHEHGHG